MIIRCANFSDAIPCKVQCYICANVIPQGPEVKSLERAYIVSFVDYAL